MKFLNRIWPWRRFEHDATEILQLKVKLNNLEWALKAEQAHHCITKEKHHETHRELLNHKQTVEANKEHFKKLATILAVKAGFSILIALCCVTASAQGPGRNVVTTNRLGAPLSTAYFLGWDGTKPAWFIPPDLTGVSVAQGTNIITRTNGQVVTVNGVTDTNVVNILLIGATNQSTVVSNGVLAHTITMAGTATGLSFTPAGAQTLSSDPSFTGKILPSAIVTNLFNSGDQYKTNGSISSTAYDIMASNNLGSFSASSGLGNFTATSGAAFLTPTNTPAVGQQIEATSTAGTTAYKNPHFLGTITGWLAGWTGVSGSNNRFMPLMGYQSSATTATEGSASGIYPAGTFTNLYVKWVALGSSTNMTITLVTNGVASNLAVSVNGTGANPNGVDTSHGVQIPDLCPASLRIVGNNPTVPSSAVIVYFSIQFSQ